MVASRIRHVVAIIHPCKCGGSSFVTLNSSPFFSLFRSANEFTDNTCGIISRAWLSVKMHVMAYKEAKSQMFLYIIVSQVTRGC